MHGFAQEEEDKPVAILLAQDEQEASEGHVGLPGKPIHACTQETFCTHGSRAGVSLAFVYGRVIGIFLSESFVIQGVRVGYSVQFCAEVGPLEAPRSGMGEGV